MEKEINPKIHENNEKRFRKESLEDSKEIIDINSSILSAIKSSENIFKSSFEVSKEFLKEKKKELKETTNEALNHGIESLKPAGKTVGKALMETSSIGRFLLKANEMTGASDKMLEVINNIKDSKNDSDSISSGNTNIEETHQEYKTPDLQNDEKNSTEKEITINIESEQDKDKAKEASIEAEKIRIEEKNETKKTQDLLSEINENVSEIHNEPIIDKKDDSIFGEALSVFGGFFKNFGGKLFSLITSPFKLFGKGSFLKKIISPIFGKIAKSFIGVLGKGLKFLGPIGAALGGLIGGINGFSKATEIFGENADKSEILSSVLGGIVDSFSFGLIDIETAAKWFDKIGGQLHDLWNSITSIFDGVPDWLIDHLTVFINPLETLFDPLLNLFGLDSIKEMRSQLFSFVGDISKIVSDFINDIFGGFSDKVTEVKDSAVEFGKKFLPDSWFDDTISKTQNGSDTISKTQNGSDIITGNQNNEILTNDSPNISNQMVSSSRVLDIAPTSSKQEQTIFKEPSIEEYRKTEINHRIQEQKEKQLLGRDMERNNNIIIKESPRKQEQIKTPTKIKINDSDLLLMSGTFLSN